MIIYFFTNLQIEWKLKKFNSKNTRKNPIINLKFIK